MQLTPSGRFLTSHESLSGLVSLVYSDSENPVPSKTVLDRDTPKWISDDGFDIDAKIEDSYLQVWDTLSNKQRTEITRPMIRQFLESRFHLKFHIEMRPTPVYALVQAKGGAHVKEVAVPPSQDDGPSEGFEQWTRDNPGKIPPGVLSCGQNGCKASAIKMSMAIGQIGYSARADRLVIDDTGLKGYYELSFPMPDHDQPNMREIEQALNVRFESRTVPIKTYVIESADKPSVD